MQRERELERAMQRLQSQNRYPAIENRRNAGAVSQAGRGGWLRASTASCGLGRSTIRPELNATIVTTRARTGAITSISQATTAAVTVATDHGLLVD